MNQSVERFGHGFRIVQRERPVSLLPNEMVLHELVSFLGRHFVEGKHQSLLDAGAGTRPYAPVYNDYFSEICSFDVQCARNGDASVNLIASAQSLPFRPDSFDCILLTEVLEHVRNPDQALAECCRVLRPGGRMFMTTPFFVPLHEVPHDFYRFTPFGLQHLSERAGLQLESVITKGGFRAFALLFVQLPWVRLWLRMSGHRLRGFFDVRNPLFYLTITWPQLIYLAFWKRHRLQRNAGGDLDGPRSADGTPVTLGYITTLKKPGS